LTPFSTIVAFVLPPYQTAAIYLKFKRAVFRTSSWSIQLWKWGRIWRRFSYANGNKVGSET